MVHAFCRLASLTKWFRSVVLKALDQELKLLKDKVQILKDMDVFVGRGKKGSMWTSLCEGF
jgi:hypothetical protein